MDIQYVSQLSAEDYSLMRKSVGWKMLSQRQIDSALKNSAYFTVAVIEGKVSAMARVISDGGYSFFIADVIVLPKYQGQGIGKQLMTNVMDYIKGNVYEGEFVLVNLMSAKGKESFYEKFGFNKRPSDDFGNGMTQWLEK